MNKLLQLQQGISPYNLSRQKLETMPTLTLLHLNIIHNEEKKKRHYYMKKNSFKNIFHGGCCGYF